MIQSLIYLVCVVLICGLALWAVDYFPVPEPLNKIAKFAIIVIACLAIILVLLNVAGVGPGLSLR